MSLMSSLALVTIRSSIASPQGQLFTLYPFLDIEGNTSAPPSLPVSSEQPVAIDSHTPVMGFVPPGFSGGNQSPKERAASGSGKLEVTFQCLEHPWVVKIHLLVSLGNIVSVWSKISKQFKNIIQRSAPRLDSYEWQGVWDSMGKCLGRWVPPVFWNFTPDQMQNPEKLVEYLEKVCCHSDNSKEIQITAMCWGLAHAYQALFNTIQNPQGSGDKMTDNVATPFPPATGTAVMPPPLRQAL
ncbi:hypothetical protein QYF61_027726 [Mycteria americana]|uniref:Uncharacterized protein n=1 Tax=Mycteria americana TaxID=33587 RepID=A0AAN7P0E7_MYCAM|nr:hypothetical protein QYF61_027726 [Mycteria americana]